MASPRVSVRFPPDLLGRVRAAAEAEGLALSDYVRRAARCDAERFEAERSEAERKERERTSLIRRAQLHIEGRE